MSKLFVGGLAWATDDSSLRSAFESFGNIEDAVVIKDRETGRSRGFGFVTFTSDEDADRAVSEMNDKDLDGRRIRVDRASQRDGGSAPRSGGFGGSSSRSGGYGGSREGGYGGSSRSGGYGGSREGGYSSGGRSGGSYGGSREGGYGGSSQRSGGYGGDSRRDDYSGY